MLWSCPQPSSLSLGRGQHSKSYSNSCSLDGVFQQFKDEEKGEYSEDPMLSTVDIDCLSGMSKLQHLEISQKCQARCGVLKVFSVRLIVWRALHSWEMADFKDHWYLHWLCFST